ncbi:Bifunctional 3'-phosphoadenosine 5'-phosphosulfate synthase 2 [Strongyloides ratti]|uniref:Bifunctional 3'-phosphoadenosine 5'-phosphosulfate synthase 2 n=1 Tax=Strongyloides ratti TaxID=34506 RepID=A0A090L450_STRRB|nr:Bifunctional 3'-phosphoadenosine 5'-phosphosulfate synthase 2 [Strongyloides ratti]CEF62892.1 Bifunctional 3'-phosphoadenosine 5'-phosphosulfate synthase 2 [Strongyloides ratti]
MSKRVSTNVIQQFHKITREERARNLGKYPQFRGCTLWFTGLPAAGKTTISMRLEQLLSRVGIPSYVLDGDNMRQGLCSNLGFTLEERKENVRRVAETAKLFADCGIITLVSLISPTIAEREEARKKHEEAGLLFFEIFVNTPLNICEKRDPKNLYKKARAGLIKGFTGIDDIYEIPTNPKLILDAAGNTEHGCVERCFGLLYDHGLIPEDCALEYYEHGIKELFAKPQQIETYQQQIECFPSIDLTLDDLQWMQVLGEGWASPLNGFMRERQYLQCLHFGQIYDSYTKFDETGNEKYTPESNRTSSQSIPIVLPINEEKCHEIGKHRHVGLKYDGRYLAILENIEIYPHRKEERICRIFGYNDKRHPGIKKISQQGDWCIGGDLIVFERINYNDGLDEYRHTPRELREIFYNANCDAIFAFQVRNPIHNGHALLMRQTREQLLAQGYKNPMLLLHPIGGWTKDDDVPLNIRIKQHLAVLEERILDPRWTVISIFPSPMLYAGPTEVQWHCKARIAAGVDCYIVGRDPAGIQNPDTGDFLYDPTHGSKILSMTPGLKGIQIIPFRVAAYNKRSGQMDFYDENHRDDYLFISGTLMRQLARNGQTPPQGFMGQKAWHVLSDYYQSLGSF